MTDGAPRTGGANASIRRGDVRAVARAAPVMVLLGLLAGCTGTEHLSSGSTAVSASVSPHVPDSVPTGVPLPTLHVLDTAVIPGQWTIWYRSADPGRDYRAAMRALRAAGYTWTQDEGTRDGGYGQACTRRWCVTVTAVTVDDRGPSLEVEVFASGQ